MNNYQYMIFKLMNRIDLINEENELIRGKINFVEKPFKIQLIQNEDYHLNKYTLLFNVQFDLEKTKILFNEGGKWVELKISKDSNKKGSYPIDFNKPINEIKFKNIFNIFDEFTLPIEFVFSDKNKYDNKIREIKEK